MHFSPRPYQQLIVAHILAICRCAIWAGMGLGKTSSVLEALCRLNLVEDIFPVLVIAPLRVARSTWPDEVTKWKFGIKVSVICGSLAERKAATDTGADLYTTNFEQLPWLIEHYGERWPFKMVIIDEATKLKGFRLRQGTQRAKALAQVAHTKVKRLVQLTGTPAPNGLADLWGQAWFIDRGERLGRTYDSFRQRWFQKSYDGFSITPLAHAQGEIQEKLADVCLTIDAKDWFNLNEPIINNIYIDLPIKARKQYEDMEKEMFAEIEGHGVEAFNAASRTIKCLQLANGAAYIDDAGNWKEVHDAKIQALDDVLEEASGTPVLVAYHFKSDLARLLRAFPHGRQLDSNSATIRDWNAGRIPLLFAHPASAGHGLNLQDGGNILAFFGHWWNLEERLQILERIGPVRQLQAGHKRPVFIHNIIARNTVDELVIERIATKREVQDILLDAMKGKKR